VRESRGLRGSGMRGEPRSDEVLKRERGKEG